MKTRRIVWRDGMRYLLQQRIGRRRRLQECKGIGPQRHGLKMVQMRRGCRALPVQTKDDRRLHDCDRRRHRQEMQRLKQQPRDLTNRSRRGRGRGGSRGKCRLSLRRLDGRGGRSDSEIRDHGLRQRRGRRQRRVMSLCTRCMPSCQRVSLLACKLRYSKMEWKRV